MRPKTKKLFASFLAGILLLSSLSLFVYMGGKRAAEEEISANAMDADIGEPVAQSTDEARYENNGNSYQGLLSECWALAEQASGGKITLLSDVTAYAYDPSVYNGTSYTENGVTKSGVSHAITRFTGGLSCMTVPSGMDVTLDLNGHVLDRNMGDADGTADRAYTIEVFDGGSFTLADSAGTGKLTGGYGSSCIDGTMYGSCAIVHEGGTFIIDGAEISGNRGQGAVTGQGTVKLTGNARITKNYNATGKECNIYVTNNLDVQAEGLGADANIGVTTVTGREISAVYCPDGDLEAFYSDLGLGTYLEGYYVAVGQEPECEWEAEFHAASGTVYTGTFSQMFEKMKTEKNGTLKLMRNISVTGTYTWNAAGNAVIDFNGYVIKGTGSSTQYFLTIDSGATNLTLTDSRGKARETARRTNTADAPVWNSTSRTYTYYVSYAEDGGTDTGIVTATDEITADFSRLGGLDLTGYGRAIFIKTGASVNITGGAYRSDNGFLQSGASGMSAAGAKVTFSGGYVYDSGDKGTSVMSGVAFYMYQGSSFSMTGGVIAGCRGMQGGAIRATNISSFSVTGGTITQCYAGYNGGAVYVDTACASTVFGSVLICNNESIERGGAVMLSKNTAAFNQTIFACNKSANGGAIQILSTGASASVTDCMIIGNSAAAGGGISQEAGSSVTLSMSGSTVTRNTADIGGGVYFENGTFSVGNGNSVEKNTDSNVYLKSGAVMTLSCVPASSNIGVTTQTGVLDGSSVKIAYNKGQYDITNCADWFFSDEGHEVRKMDDYVIIGLAQAEGPEAEWYSENTGKTSAGTFSDMWEMMAADGSGTLKLLRDVHIQDTTYMVSVSGLDAVLDLNGHVIHAEAGESGKRLFTIQNNLSHPFVITDSAGKAVEKREIVDEAGDMSYDESKRVLVYYVQYPNEDNTGVITEKVTADFSNYGGLDVTGYDRAVYVGNGWVDIQGGAHRSRNGFMHSVWEFSKMEVTGGYIFDSGVYGSGYGGAIYAQSGASLNIENAVIVGCKTVNGGGINSNIAAEITNSTITQCEASWSGGVLYQGYGEIDINGSLICLNKSNGSRAGAMLLRSGSMTDSKFSGNASGTNGGAVSFFQNDSFAVTGCVIMNNTAKSNGAGIEVSAESPNIQLKDTVISGNTAGGKGSGMYISTGRVSAYDGLVISGNTNDNLYLAKDNLLVLDKSIMEGMDVYVTTEEIPSFGYNMPFADNTALVDITNADDWFTSDLRYYIWPDGDRVYLSVEPYENVVFDGVLVQFYAYTERLDFSTDEGYNLQIIDTAGAKLPTNDSTPYVTNIHVDTEGDVITTRILTQIYADKDEEPGDITIAEVNSFYRNNYTMHEIWVAKPGTKFNSKDPDDWEIMPYDEHAVLALEKGDIVRIVAECTEDVWNSEVIFYDYDITDGGWYLNSQDRNDGVNQQATSTQPDEDSMTKTYVTAKGYGINSTANYSGSGTKLAFGNANMDTGYEKELWQSPAGPVTINQYNRVTNGAVVTFGGASYGIASHLDADGNIVYSPGIDAPALFSRDSAIGKSTYMDYGFDFIRRGDTYTLSAVTGTETNGLEKFYNPGIYDGVQNKTVIWTNNFWPMDSVPSYGADGHDIKFGSDIRKNNVTQYMTAGNIPVSDDGLDHNPYFGFQFDIMFFMPEGYRGPMEYIFFGDDDIWVFLDGQLICDIGGVHSAIGEYVNIWDYLEKDDTAEHTLSVFYTERGASGSTCWMQFTMPNVVSTTRTPVTFAYSFEKTDEDGLALSGAEFTLCADEGCEEVLKISESNADGHVTFTDLLHGQTYYVKETKAPDGYVLEDAVYVLVQDEDGAWYMYRMDDKDKMPVDAVVNVRDSGPVMPNTGKTDALVLLAFGFSMLFASVLVFCFAGRKRGA